MQSVFWVHVGKEIIEKTLKRIRELEEKGVGNDLHKRKIVIHYSENERIANIDGENIKKIIESYVPHGIEKYVEKKNELLNTLGFEDGSAQINFKLSGEHKVKQMVDVTLGIRKNIEVDKIVGHRSRFGIISKIPFIDSKEGMLSIQAVEPSKRQPKNDPLRQPNFDPPLI